MVSRGGPWEVLWYAVEDAVEGFAAGGCHGMPRHVVKKGNNVHRSAAGSRLLLLCNIYGEFISGNPTNK